MTSDVTASPTAWLFQANPDTFDIEGFLKTSPATFLWVVRRSADQMAPGDTVFIWRAIGSGEKSRSGAVAETEIVEPARVQPDDADSAPYWRDGGDPSVPENRIRLRLIRSANEREIVRREWLLDDPDLSDMTILKAAVGTNFRLNAVQTQRLAALWARTGNDWTYAESVAGMWAYDRTLGREVSRKLPAPVPEVALLIGRAVSGVYNKVMNFRHLDPRDSRAGFSGAGESDRLVWAKFFDPLGHIRSDDLQLEFDRLWRLRMPAMSVVGADDADPLAKEVARLERGSLADLLARYAAKAAKRARRPGATVITTRRFERDPLVVAIARVRAGIRCEVPACGHPVFDTDDGTPYCEVHHIEPLEVGGADTPENVACVCPAHHREAHLGRNAAKVTNELQSVRLKDAELNTRKTFLASD